MLNLKNDAEIIKVIFILLILSITPFIRGCRGISEPTETITVGFPVPIITSYFNTNDGKAAYKPCFPSDVYPFNFVFNSVILLLIVILLYKKRDLKISPIFFNALLINSIFCWFTAFFIFTGYKLNYIIKAYYFAYMCIASIINMLFFKLTYIEPSYTGLWMHILARLSFLTVTFITAILFYFINSVFRKTIKMR